MCGIANGFHLGVGRRIAIDYHMTRGLTLNLAISNHDRAIALITTFECSLLQAKGTRYE